MGKTLVIENLSEVPDEFTACNLDIENVNIGEGVTTIGAYAFRKCPKKLKKADCR